MKNLYELFKGMFFFMAVFVGIFYLRGQYLIKNSECTSSQEKLLCLIDESTFQTLASIIMPLFLMLSGTVIGYIIATIWIIKTEPVDENETKKIYIKSFSIGIVIGLILSAIYSIS